MARMTRERVLTWFSNQEKYRLKSALPNDEELRSRTEVLISCLDCGYERSKILSEIVTNRYSCMGCRKIKNSVEMKGKYLYSHEEYVEKLRNKTSKATVLSTYTNGQDKGFFYAIVVVRNILILMHQIYIQVDICVGRVHIEK